MLRIKGVLALPSFAFGQTILGEPMSVARNWQRRSPVLSDPQLTRYLLAVVVSTTGTAVSMVALPILVYQRSGSPVGWRAGRHPGGRRPGSALRGSGSSEFLAAERRRAAGGLMLISGRSGRRTITGGNVT
jgi:hypothetical protein